MSRRQIFFGYDKTVRPADYGDQGNAGKGIKPRVHHVQAGTADAAAAKRYEALKLEAGVVAQLRGDRYAIDEWMLVCRMAADILKRYEAQHGREGV